jgi:uncharacterized protein YndB with AHSA1/START domain
MTALADIVKTLRIEAPIDRAFSAYVDGIAAWWPVDTHSVSGAGSVIELSPTGCFETAPDGTRSEWGTVTMWDAPTHVAHTWHPGSLQDPHTDVDITFTGDDSGTTVVLTHSGWDAAGAEARDRDDYDSGWDYVLGCYFAYASFAQ